MNTMTGNRPRVIGGVDTHVDFHVAVALDELGRVLGTESFPADHKGYVALLSFLRRHGEIDKVGVEGTGSYGAGLARHLRAEGVEAIEVIRPNRQVRRRRGKSDPTDAEAAARAVQSGEASGAPKSRDGAAESLRALRVARQGAVKARTQAANQLRDLVVSAPEILRATLRPLSTAKRVALAARFRPGGLTDPIEATKAAMRSVARRYEELSTEIAELDKAMTELVEAEAPKGLTERRGVGTQVAATLIATAGDNPTRLRSDASFAALCGASPVDASSGKQVRHRLNRGGDRQANSALWRIVHTRMLHDPRTIAYVERRTKEGKTRKEIIRCLKRYVAREIYKALVARTTTGTEITAVLAA
jgi:transposase